MARNGWSLMLFCVAFASAAISGQTSPPAPAASFDSEGYRASRYRAPVDRSPYPARRIRLSKALQMHQRNRAIFIDVAPVESGYRDPTTGVWALSQPHTTIAGAVWHPETGRTPPDPVLWHALVRSVLEETGRRPGRPIVVFCRSDCWMGWNAARRLARGGVHNVYWLAEGNDGWHQACRALVGVQPVVVAPEPADAGVP